MDTVTYMAAELAAEARKLFNTTPEVVSVALKVASKERATVEEARICVQAFLTREVK